MKKINCPICGREIEGGVIVAHDAASVMDTYTTLNWYSEEEYEKKWMRKPIDLELKGEGYYCDECMKVFAVFDEKYHWKFF